MDLGYAKKQYMKRITSWHWHEQDNQPPQQGASAEFTGGLTDLWAYVFLTIFLSFSIQYWPHFSLPRTTTAPDPPPPTPHKKTKTKKVYRMEPGEGCKGKKSH